MRTLGSNRRIETVSWENDGVVGEGEEQLIDRGDDGVEISTFVLGGAWPAWKQRVASEEQRSALEME